MADQNRSPLTPPVAGGYVPPGTSRSASEPQVATKLSAADDAVRIDRPAGLGQRDTGTRASSMNSAPQSGSATSMLEDVKLQAAELKDKAAMEAGRAAQDAAQAAKVAGRRMRERGVEFASQQKTVAAEEMAHVGEALHAAADTLRQKNDRYTGDVAAAAAERIESLAGYLRDRDLSGLVRDVEGLARRQPELFYGGLFALGLGAGRFLRASQRNESQSF